MIKSQILASKHIFSWVIGLLILLCNPLVSAQGNAVTGKVISATSNDPLIGATLHVGEIYTITDINGDFLLEGVKMIDSVVVTYVGFATTKLSLNKGNTEPFIIRLKESENLLQTATVTSGKFDKPLGEITVSMEVLKPQLLENVNATSLDQVLEKVPGVTIIDGQPNIRGGSGYSFGAGSRVLLLIDDIPALQSDAGFPNWDDIPIELTNQIEVLKGASSALFGSSAMNGIINLRTDFAKEKAETKIASFVTVYNSPKDGAKKWWGPDTDTIPLDIGTYITHKQKFGKLDVVGSVYIRNHQKWNKNSYDIYQRGALGLRYRLNKNWTVGLNGNFRNGKNSSFFYWQNADSLAMTGNPGSFSQSESVRYVVDPFVQYADEKGNKHKFLGRYYDVKNNLINNQSNFSNLAYGEYQYQKRFLKSDMVVTAGLVGSLTRSEAELYSNSEFTSNNLAAYAQVDKKFFDKLNVSLGLRYERNQINAPDSIPINDVLMLAGADTEARPVFRLGVNYQVGEYTYLRASYGQGYRFPTIAEKYINTQVGFAISPNLDLKSETGWSAEIGIKQGIKINEFKALFDFAVFQTEYKDMMEFTFSNVIAIGFQSQNVGNTVVRGFDVNLAGGGKIFDKLPINALIGYTYLDPKFKTFGDFEMNTSSSPKNILKYRYQHTGKLDLATDTDKFNIGIAGFYYSPMEAIDRLFNFFIPGLEDYRAANNKPFSVWNVRMSYPILSKIKGSLHINNALNTEYTLRPGLIEPPRHIIFRLDFEL